VTNNPVRAVLFDLDGTIADTAPDLGGALNRLRADHNLPPLPIAQLALYASSGARGLIGAGFSITPDHAEFPEMRDRFLDYYEAALCVDTRLFDGINDLLEALEARHIIWGIVTNKGSRFTHPLIAAMNLKHRAGCVVSGDDCKLAKPAPDTLLLACSQLAIAPQDAIYVGDDLRDMHAGHAAGMRAIAAGWGYLGEGQNVSHWPNDGIAQHPSDVLGFL
jgi:N-acetyl-D-muramate 6-phosphate phosphatase